MIDKTNNILFSYITNVRVDDLNYGNHLCHTKFINLIHNTRALFLKSHDLSELNCFGSFLVMLNLNIDYLSQCYFDDKLEITLEVTAIEKASVVFSYNIFNKTSNKLAASATTTMGFLNKESSKLRRVHAEFIELINSLNK